MKSARLKYQKSCLSYQNLPDHLWNLSDCGKSEKCDVFPLVVFNPFGSTCLTNVTTEILFSPFKSSRIMACSYFVGKC